MSKKKVNLKKYIRVSEESINSVLLLIQSQKLTEDEMFSFWKIYERFQDVGIIHTRDLKELNHMIRDSAVRESQVREKPPVKCRHLNPRNSELTPPWDWGPADGKWHYD